MDEKDTRFTLWLNGALESRRLSQAELARALGVSDAQVSRWRRGQVVPTVHSLQRLADTLGVPRAMLDHLAGYPVERQGEGEVQGAQAPETAARLRGYQAWFATVLSEQLPPELWQTYAEGCAALARTLSASYAAGQHRVREEPAKQVATTDEGGTTGGEQPGRDIGFRR